MPKIDGITYPEGVQAMLKDRVIGPMFRSYLDRKLCGEIYVYIDETSKKRDPRSQYKKFFAPGAKHGINISGSPIATARKLAGLFIENFKQFEEGTDDDVLAVADQAIDALRVRRQGREHPLPHQHAAAGRPGPDHARPRRGAVRAEPTDGRDPPAPHDLGGAVHHGTSTASTSTPSSTPRPRSRRSWTPPMTSSSPTGHASTSCAFDRPFPASMYRTYANDWSTAASSTSSKRDSTAPTGSA